MALTNGWRDLLGVVILALVVLQSPPGVLSQRKPKNMCSKQGIFNSTTKRCTCVTGWTGPLCNDRFCPAGHDWLATPHGHHLAHKDHVECSGVGECDRLLGTCTCKTGFGGAACEKMVCPKGATNSTGEVVKTCSGHGRCMTLREMGGVWTGNDNLEIGGLVYKPRDYNLWDADQIQGCVCDPPYTGHNCSLKSCPYGDDYSVRFDPYGQITHHEVMRIECAANQGSFRFAFRGVSSEEIPFDAPQGRVKHILEKMTSIDSISVSMTSSTVCGNGSPTITTITFLNQAGEMPAAKVTPQSNLKLNSGASPAILNMVTQFVMECPMMQKAVGHVGSMHLKYDGELTRAINYTASVTDVESAIRNLTTIRHHSDYGHINVTASSASPLSTYGIEICSYLSHVNTTIELRSEYGNLHMLDAVNDIFREEVDANITMHTSKGTTQAKLCSDRGHCDYKSGTCECFFQSTPFMDIKRRYESSDGNGNPGRRGDCGYAQVVARKCPDGLTNIDDPLSLETCYGNGFCDNSTYACRCSEGYQGSDCSERVCPSGVGWFDTVQGDGYAHQTKRECSGQGSCDRVSGHCHCENGFTGEACDKIICEDECNGVGVCQPLHKLAEYAVVNGEATEYAYGNPDANFNSKATWDREMFQSCLCDGTFLERDRQGPSDTFISGLYVNEPKVLGYHGYSCKKAYCPHGDDPSTPGVNEKQTVSCTLTTGSFTLTFRDKTTASIAYDATAATVKAALEALNVVETVTVTLNAANPCDAVPSGFVVEFTGNPGDLPLMKSAPSFTVAETIKGTKEFVECSNRGVCNSKAGQLAGMCYCDWNYMSSDGNGGRGTRRDCGKYDEYGQAVGYFTS
ncbi:hypothetical protein TrST_g2898 [Triparma strigata]|uniref:EGF-like domain-containing protein n=1 Tax=Triparma strigata TaxID=1606541 RepID=A0A9W7EVQ9_9STRA|nr:hypothetical protein TrST_g2898 [Triparma strigata]